MPRRREVPERVIIPDLKHDSKLVSKFVACIMRDGKKSVAESILYGAFDIMEERTSKPAVKAFEQAVDNVRPMIEVKSRRVGGSTYQVPTEVRPSRRTALGIRWIIGYARKRPEKGMAKKLAAELMDAANNTGGSVRIRDAIADIWLGFRRWSIEFSVVIGQWNYSDLGYQAVLNFRRRTRRRTDRPATTRNITTPVIYVPHRPIIYQPSSEYLSND